MFIMPLSGHLCSPWLFFPHKVDALLAPFSLQCDIACRNWPFSSDTCCEGLSSGLWVGGVLVTPAEDCQIIVKHRV